jgi:hypothetical protein
LHLADHRAAMTLKLFGFGILLFRFWESGKEPRLAVLATF